MDTGSAGPGDPYFDWSARRAFTGHASAAGSSNPRLCFLVELDEAAKAAKLAGAGFDVPDHYTSGKAAGGCFVTARCSLDAVATLAKSSGVVRLAMGIAQEAHAQREAVPGNTAGAAADCEGLVLGVIDRDIAFLNEAFRESRSDPGRRARARVLAFWDQGRAPVKDPWATPAAFGYGRELTGNALADCVADCATRSDEERIYRELDYLAAGSGLLRQQAHGTHVADTLAGLAEPRELMRLAKPQHDDEASAAKLVFVSLPKLGPHDTTGASSDAHILDAVQYVLRTAGPRARVLINLSVGAQAGPHDGSAAIVRALDAILAERPQTAIVTAAGNGRESHWNASGVVAPAAQASLGWRTLPGDVTDSFLELWLRGDRAAPALRVVDPQGHASDWASIGSSIERTGADGSGTAARLAVHDRTALGDGAMALLSLAPAALLAGRTAPSSTSPAGHWRIEIENRGDGELRVDAWVQRDEPPDGLQGGVQSSLVASEVLVIDGGDTRSSLCGGRLALSVGATTLAGEPARYSATADPEAIAEGIPSAAQGAAAADSDRHTFGLLGAGVLSSSHFLMSGTSVAAPRFGRRWAALLASGSGGRSAEDLRKQALVAPT